MARFRFKLSGVLRQREMAEQQRQRELAEQQREMVKYQEELARMQRQVVEANETLRSQHLIGPLSTAYLSNHQRYMLVMQRQTVETIQRMALQQRKVEEAQKLLAEAAKQRKMIEKLRERQLEAWRADQARREQAELDEIGMQLAFRAARDLLNEPSD